MLVPHLRPKLAISPHPAYQLCPLVRSLRFSPSIVITTLSCMHVQVSLCVVHLCWFYLCGLYMSVSPCLYMSVCLYLCVHVRWSVSLCVVCIYPRYFSHQFKHVRSVSQTKLGSKCLWWMARLSWLLCVFVSVCGPGLSVVSAHVRGVFLW